MLSRVFKGRAERIRRENKSKGKCKETFSNFICSIYIYIYIFIITAAVGGKVGSDEC